MFAQQLNNFGETVIVADPCASLSAGGSSPDFGVCTSESLASALMVLSYNNWSRGALLSHALMPAFRCLNLLQIAQRLRYGLLKMLQSEKDCRKWVLLGPATILAKVEASPSFSAVSLETTRAAFVELSSTFPSRYLSLEKFASTIHAPPGMKRIPKYLTCTVLQTCGGFPGNVGSAIAAIIQLDITSDQRTELARSQRPRYEVHHPPLLHARHATGAPLLDPGEPLSLVRFPWSKFDRIKLPRVAFEGHLNDVSFLGLGLTYLPTYLPTYRPTYYAILRACF